jgi:hypothetical protein
MTTPTYPSTPEFESINFTIETPLLKTQTNSGKLTRVAMGHQYYSFTVNYPNMTARDLGAVSGFIALTLGGYSAFQIVLPKLSYTKSLNPSDAGLTFTVSANTSSGANSVSYSVGGSGTDNKEYFAAGDFIKFSNYSKVYQVAQTSVTDGSGNGTLVIGGALVENVTTSTTIQRNAVPFTCVFASDAQEFDTGAGGISSLSLDMREVW